MVRFARVTGMISAVSKGLLLLVIGLWMTAIIVVAADCSQAYVFRSLLGLSVVVLVGFLSCLLVLLSIAQKNASHGDWQLPNETLFDGAYHRI